jgi:hypothetical protein
MEAAAIPARAGWLPPDLQAMMDRLTADLPAIRQPSSNQGAAQPSNGSLR